jgi:hypothetical protein
MAERLEVILEVRPGSYTRTMVFRRGRPSLSRVTRKALRSIRRARSVNKLPKFAFCGAPRYPRPDLVRRLENPLRDVCCLEVSYLEDTRCDDQDFWRHLSTIPYHSKAEKRTHIQAARAGATLAAIRSLDLGCQLTCVDGKTGREHPRRLYPAFIWRWKDLSLALIPQRCVRMAMGHLSPDNILIASRRGRKITAVVEVDGQPYHQDAAAERRRDKKLGVPVLHLPAVGVQMEDVMERLQNWARELLVGQTHQSAVAR